MNRFGLILFAIMVTVIGAAVTSAVWNGAASAHDDGELPFVEFDEGVVGSVNVQNDVQTVVFSPSGKLIDADDSFNDAAPTLKMLGAVVTKTFTDFTSSNLSSLQLNNNTATQNPNSDDVLRLTSAGTNKSGSAFLTDTISLGSQSSFSTAFQFRIHSSGGSFQGGGADGLVFVVQTVSNSAGTTGSGIGYKGINNSVGIEFDTFNNGTSEGACESSFGENHVGINVGGSICSNPQIDVTSSLGALDAGTTFFAWVDFDGSSNDLEVRLSTTASRPSTALLSKNVDLVAELGTSDAFVGFTSATGGSFSAHDIVAWQFTNSFQPIQEIVPDPEADLELTKTDSPDPVIAGANLTYTITVTNNSTSTAASNVQIKDKLPSGTSLVSAVVTGGSCSGTTEITCSFSSLGAGSSTVATIVVKVNTGTSGTLTNVASTTSDTLDPVASNNSAQTTTQVATPTADLELTKTDSPDPVIAGANLTYVITVTNNSTSNAATNVQVTDALPTGTTLVSAVANGGGSCSGTTSINCTFSTLAAGASATVTIVVTVNTGTSGPLTNAATATSDTLDTVTSNNTAQTTTQVSTPAADLKVTKTGSPDPVIAGTNLTYVIVVTNNSTTTAATNVEVKDKLPPGTSLVSVNATGGGTCSGTTDITCTFSSLAPESAVVATIVVKVDVGATGSLTNVATTTADTLDNAIGNNSFKAVTQVSPPSPVPNVSPWMLAALAGVLLLTFSGPVRRRIMQRSEV